MSTFKAGTSFYSEGGKHFNQGEEITSEVYFSLTATDKGKFTEIPDAVPAPAAQAPSAGQEDTVVSGLAAKAEGMVSGGNGSEDTGIGVNAADGQVQMTDQANGQPDAKAQAAQLLTQHHQSIGEKFNAFAMRVGDEAKKIFGEIKEEGEHVWQEIEKILPGHKQAQS